MAQFGNLLRVSPSPDGRSGEIARIDRRKPTKLEQFVGKSLRGWVTSHPCIGARSVAVNGNLFLTVVDDMQSISSAMRTVCAVEEYLEISDLLDTHIKTLAIIFIDRVTDEIDFAQKYWRFAQIVHDIDCLTHPWDPTVSDNPTDSNFEFSIAGRAIFTTTLNPGHPRVARKFSHPTWVCNQTQQFNRLRERGAFERWQESIRKADAEIDPSGKPNPLLTDHGYASAADQLAGFPIKPCPLLVRRTKDDREAAADHITKLSATDQMEADIRDELTRRTSNIL
jgi:FPC/CPF motif-containing protein YcgG